MAAVRGVRGLGGRPTILFDLVARVLMENVTNDRGVLVWSPPANYLSVA